MLDAVVDPRMSAKLGVVRGEHNAVFACPIGPDAVVGEGFRRVEVEHEKEVGPSENNDFVRLFVSVLKESARGDKAE